MTAQDRAADRDDRAPAAAAWWRETAEARVAERRAQYLRRVGAPFDDHRPIALALAYRRLGYSSSGIAARLDTTEATVQAWMGAVASKHGERAVESALPSELAAWPDAAFLPHSGGERR